MERRRLFAVAARLVIAAVIVAAMAVPGLTQTLDKTDALRNTEDSLRQAYREKVKALGDFKKDTITGWLIVDGEYIPGPYEVVVTENSVLVNGFVAIATPPKQENVVVDPEYIAREEFTRERDAGFDSVYMEKGDAAAKKWVYEYLLQHPLVDTVYPSELADLAVKYVDYKYAVHLTLLPPDEKPPPQEERDEIFKKNLYRRADGLRGSLSHGSLVIRGKLSGGNHVICFPESIFVMDELMRITSAIPVLEKRVAAIKNIIGNDDQAKLIAERFKAKPAEVEK